MAGMAKRPVLILVLLIVVSARTRAEEPSAAMSKSAGDTRKPLPLPMMMAQHQKQNMREHLSAVQAIIAAIRGDWKSVLAIGLDPLGVRPRIAF